MSAKRKNSPSNADKPRRDDAQKTVLERVEELTWALLDDNISDDEMSLLDTLLLTGDDARNRYIECVQLHTDLMAHYAEPSQGAVGAFSKSPILSSLNTGMSSIGLPSPRNAD